MSELALLCSILVPSVARADAPPGLYKLGLRGTPVVSVNGKRMPPCDKAISAPVEGTAIVVSYKDGVVVVDGVRWNVFRKNPDSTQAVLNFSSKDVRFEILFWRDGQDGHADLDLYGLDDKGHAKCVDALSLLGSYAANKTP
jgi:hypothetical protein